MSLPILLLLETASFLFFGDLYRFAFVLQKSRKELNWIIRLLQVGLEQCLTEELANAILLQIFCVFVLWAQQIGEIHL